MPNRPPLFDLLRNDAVISHFAGERLDEKNALRAVYAAHRAALDGTRPTVRLPSQEREELLPDGRRRRFFRWTTWTAHRVFSSTQDYEVEKQRVLKEAERGWTPEDDRNLQIFMERLGEDRQRLEGMFYFPSVPNVGLMGIYGEVGLEFFSYCVADCPGVIEGLLEMNTAHTTEWVSHLPENHGIEAVFVGDDMAFKTGPMLSPVWFRKCYFARLARVTNAFHRRGIRVLFHSDGNLMSVLDGLVEAGIDGLNPIEVLAGMDLGTIHRRHPHLFLAGGIDVSELLPHGTPAMVRDVVKRAIEDAGGRLLVGSSTELHEAVPLENFLAMRETALAYRYAPS